MPEALIFDAVRTPRSKGKKDGSLHEITPIHLLKNMFDALRDRNNLAAMKVMSGQGWQNTSLLVSKSASKTFKTACCSLRFLSLSAPTKKAL